MEDRLNFLTEFSFLMKKDVVDYYKKSHLYLIDLVSYKNIDLKIITSTETDEAFEETLIKMLKAIKTGLNTLGVPISRLTEIQKNYLNEMNKRSIEKYDYNACLQHYLNEYVNKILFEILMEYLFDLDTKKLEALKLFKLVPSSFVDKLDHFKKKINISDKKKEYITLSGIEEYLNISDLSIKIEPPKKNPNKIDISIMNEERESGKTEEKKSDGVDILKQLEEARKNSIESLKTPRTEVFKSSIEQLELVNLKEDYQKIAEDIKQIPSNILKENIEPPLTADIKYPTKEKKEIFLDHIGNLPSLDPEILNRFKKS